MCIVCQYEYIWGGCNKELIIGEDYFYLCESDDVYKIMKCYEPIGSKDVSKCHLKDGYFCNYEHAYKYGASKGYIFRD